MTSEIEIRQPDHDFVLQAVLGCVRDELEYFKVTGIGPDSDLVELDKKYALFESLGFDELIMTLEDKLGVQWTPEEIREIFCPIWHSAASTSAAGGDDTPSTLTVAALTDFIRVRIKPVSFEPVSVLGSPPCPAAG
jgi:acyl carrier protein